MLRTLVEVSGGLLHSQPAACASQSPGVVYVVPAGYCLLNILRNRGRY